MSIEAEQHSNVPLQCANTLSETHAQAYRYQASKLWGVVACGIFFKRTLLKMLKYAKTSSPQ